jgi:hypothetical protein
MSVCIKRESVYACARERGRKRVCVRDSVCVCVCVCGRERESFDGVKEK